MHANYLVQDSGFVQNMLPQWFVPSIVIPDVEHDTMTNYLTSTYIENLPTTHLVGPVCKTFTRDGYLSLACLYLLGERFQNQELKHATLAEVKRISTLLDIDMTATFPGPEDIGIIYKGTS